MRPLRRMTVIPLLAVLLAAAWPAAASADNPQRDDGRELQVGGLYEGVERTGNEIHGGRAVVTVNRPGKRVTLVLSAYNSVTWEIKTDGKTAIEKVFLGGYHRQ